MISGSFELPDGFLARFVFFSAIELGFFPELKPSSKTISIRLPESLVEAIKLLANKQDIPYLLNRNRGGV